MEKLEFEKLSAYLPYGLKWSLRGLKTFTMIGLTKETLFTKEGAILNWSSKYNSPQALFPILHPLSDLTEVIEHNGEKFVPMNILNGKGSGLTGGRELAQMLFEGDYSVYYIQWAILEKLLEWHFDTEGLIEKGLAIDINTL